MGRVATAGRVDRGRRAASTAGRALAFVARDPALAFASAIVVVLVGLAVVGRLAWQYDSLTVDVENALEPPSWDHPMGTDGNGRDVFARFNEGAGISLLAGAVVVGLGAIVGGLIGVVAGIGRRLTDSAWMRVLDAILAFPPLILAMAVTVGLGVGVRSAVLGIALTTVPYYARLLRTDILRIRALPHVEAAVALGATRTRIVQRHILPHASSAMLIQSAAVFGYAILTLAALGFVGLGAQIPEPEWGSMITDGLQYALTGQWWIAVFPGLGLLAAVTAANVFADRARDLLDPRGEIAVARET
ncbi:MAG: ABC transporter permease [Actinobacteria bacterium]|nr:ABC transporter permease [Actinomycetota bacterium]